MTDHGPFLEDWLQALVRGGEAPCALAARHDLPYSEEHDAVVVPRVLVTEDGVTHDYLATQLEATAMDHACPKWQGIADLWPVRHTVVVRLRADRLGVDADGDLVTVETASITAEVDPTEPACSHPEGHQLRGVTSPHNGLSRAQCRCCGLVVEHELHAHEGAHDYHAIRYARDVADLDELEPCAAFG